MDVEKERRLGRTHDQIVSPWKTLLLARLGASENCINDGPSQQPTLTDEMSMY